MSVKVTFKFLIAIKTLFSADLKHFVKFNETNAEHDSGRIEIFNGKPMAIGGFYTRSVEIMRNGQWENITTVGNRTGNLYHFSSLIIPGDASDVLFVFGIQIFVFFILTISARWMRS